MQNKEKTAVMKEAETSFWGYVRHNIKNGSPSLFYGRWNNRPLIPKDAETIAAAMLKEGVRRCEERTSIPIVVKEKDLGTVTPVKTFRDDLNEYPLLKSVLIDGVTRVDALGGQHRAAAVDIIVKRATAYINEGQGKNEMVRLHKLIAQVRSQLEKTSEGARHNELQGSLRKLEAELDAAERQTGFMASIKMQEGEWLLKVYVEGK